MGRKIIPRIRLTSAKVLVEVEAELGKKEKRKNNDVFSGHYRRCQSTAQTPTDWNADHSCQYLGEAVEKIESIS